MDVAETAAGEGWQVHSHGYLYVVHFGGDNFVKGYRSSPSVN